MIHFVRLILFTVVTYGLINLYPFVETKVIQWATMDNLKELGIAFAISVVVAVAYDRYEIYLGAKEDDRTDIRKTR